MPTTAAILLSRQPLRPTAKSGWVQQTIKAVRWLKESNLTLCTSLGMQTWELITSLAAMQDVGQRIFIPSGKKDDFARQCQWATDQFSLSDSVVEFVPVVAHNSGAAKEDVLRARDKAVIDAADLLIPVSIRKTGGMASLIAESGKEVLTDFRTEYADRQSPLAYLVASDSHNPEPSEIGNSYLTHWTRGINNAWPKERLIDFYRDVIESDNWPRSAFETLRRIVNTRCIIASARHMPDGESTVAFSALSPLDVIPLMRWRARYSQMAFEPYGIGIEREYALNHGVTPVAYYLRSQSGTPDEVPRWLRQSAGEITDWRTEHEYRYRGDLSLNEIPEEKLILFCRYTREAGALERESGIRAVAFAP